MGSHPLNLALRFLLELAALAALGYWGWTQNSGAWRYLLMLGLPLLAAVVWGTFAVPGDPSRSGRAPVPVPGAVRLLLELAFFAAAVVALLASGQALAGLLLAAVTIIHYILAYDRIGWLLGRDEG